MTLTSREQAIIGYALNLLALDTPSVLNADATELRDLAQKVFGPAE
jgi:hypothetical protein